jgi:hypothetical protein
MRGRKVVLSAIAVAVVTALGGSGGGASSGSSGKRLRLPKRFIRLLSPAG